MCAQHPSPITWTLITVVLLLGACGGGAEQAAPEGDAPKSESANSRETPVSAESKSPEPAGLCSLITPEEVTAALSGKLPLAPPETLDAGCKYPVLFGIDGNAVSYSKLSRGNYDAYKNYENQSSVDFEYLEGLGQEAFVINNAQVCVLLDDDNALLVVAQVIAIQEELPITQEELKAGLIEIATKVEAHL